MGFPCRDIEFYAVTVRQGTALQLGLVHVTDTLCHDRMALCCVATKKARSVRQTRLCVHVSDRPGRVRMKRLGAHDRGILSRQRFLCRDRLHIMVKKKKGLLGIGVPQ